MCWMLDQNLRNGLMNYLIKGAGRCGSHWFCETLQKFTNFTVQEINCGSKNNTDTKEYRNYLENSNNMIVHNHYGFIPKDTQNWHFVFLYRKDILKRVSSVYFTRITNDNNINLQRIPALLKKYQTQRFGIPYKKFDDIYNEICYIEMLLLDEIKNHTWKSVHKLCYEDFIDNEDYIQNTFNFGNSYNLQRRYRPSIFNIDMLENYQQLKEYVDKKYKDVIINYD